MTSGLRSVTNQLFPDQPAWVFLRRWRWLIVIAGLLLALILDASDFDLPDFIVYGLALTFLSWLVFTVLADVMAQRAAVEQALQRHEHFSRQINECSDWYELTRYLTELPSSIQLPVKQVSLFMYEHRTAQLQFVAGWPADSLADNVWVTVPATSEVCQPHQLFRLRQLTECVPQPATSPTQAPIEYCLPLKTNGLLIGALHLTCHLGESLSPGDVKFLDTIAPDISLALVSSVAHPRQLDLARLQAQLAERQHLVSVLHDTVAQELFFLQLGLEQIAQDPDTALSEANWRKLARLQTVSTEVYERIRSNLSSLHAWQHVGFTEAVKQLVNAVAVNSNLAIDLTMEGEIESLTAPVSQQVFDMIRESLTNVEKHAQAHHVLIVLSWTEDRLTVSISDDGVGFEPAQQSASEHYGLAMMRDKITSLAGEFQVESAPGAGTRLCFGIPYRAASRQMDNLNKVAVNSTYA